MVIDADLLHFIQRYIEHFRGEAECERVFVTWSGRPLEACDVANAITSELLQVGFQHGYANLFLRSSSLSILHLDQKKRNRKVCCNLIRDDFGDNFSNC